MLMRSDIHELFDLYMFGIDPDVSASVNTRSLCRCFFPMQGGYMVTVFHPMAVHLDGRPAWIAPHVESKYQPSPALLREHFRQCVLANVKGKGRKDDEFFDFEEEHDLSNTEVWGYRQGGDPDQPSRLELEVRTRLIG